MSSEGRPWAWSRARAALLVVAALLSSAPVAHAGPGAPRASDVEKRRKEYWGTFTPRLLEALNRRRVEYMKFHDRRPGADLAAADAGVRELSAEIEAIEADAAMAQIADASRSDAPVAALVEAYLSAVDEACTREDECLADGFAGLSVDHRPVFARHALDVRLDAIRAELVKFTAAAAVLAAKGLPVAERRDGERDWRRRVAIADALRGIPEVHAAAPLRALATAKLFPIRLAALEALVAFGGETGTSALATALTDESRVVQYAGIDAAAGRMQGDIRAATLLAGYMELQSDAAPRLRAAAALAKVSGCAASGDPAYWREVVGRWDERTKVVAPKAATPDGTPVVRAYGLAVPAERVVFLAEWSFRMTEPCRVSLAKTRSTTDWFGIEKSWERDCPSHVTTIRRELGQAIAGAGPALRFGIVRLSDGARDAWPKLRKDAILGLGGLVTATPRGQASATEFLAAVEPGWGLRHDALSGILQAYEIAACGPSARPNPAPGIDAIFLVTDGLMGNGRFLLPEHEIAFLRRLHRMRRVPIHVARISDEGPSAKARAEGIALATGGEQRHATFEP